jgi:hypothetical protein
LVHPICVPLFFSGGKGGGIGAVDETFGEVRPAAGFEIAREREDTASSISLVTQA